MSKEEVIRFHDFKTGSLFSPSLSVSSQMRNLGSSRDLKKRWKAKTLDVKTLLWGTVFKSMDCRPKLPGLRLISKKLYDQQVIHSFVPQFLNL